MAKVNFYHDCRKPRLDGTCPLLIQVTEYRNSQRKRLSINTEICILPAQFDGIRIVNHPQFRLLNAQIASKFTLVNYLVNELKSSGKWLDTTPEEFKSYYERQSIEPPVQESPTFKEYFNIMMQRPYKDKTRDLYNFTYSKVEKYCNINFLRIEDINYAWLQNFDNWLANTGSSMNTRAIHMENIRAVYNEAINYDAVDYSKYPFRKFKIKKQETRHRALTTEQLIQLRDYDCKEFEYYRDMFMLVFYLIGINGVDLLTAEKLREGRLEYRRSKTSKLFSVKVEPEALAIIKKYKGKKHLVKPMDTYNNYKDFMRRWNDNLQKIGPMEYKGGVRNNRKCRKPLFPEITTYWARHTWASIAADIDIPDDTISLALGHAGGNRTTNIYIRRNMRKVDEANRKVIDYLNNLSGK